MSSQAIILIPGIKGTKLTNTNRATHDVIWSGLQAEFESIEDLALTEPLDGKNYDQAPKVIIRPGEIETLAYGEFIRDLPTEKPIFIFHYDWRMTATQNAAKLATFLDYLIDKSHAGGWSKPIEKFDFVTHSLGNFVLRVFLNAYETDLVHKVVFVVPPFKGSLEIVSAVLVGEGTFSWTKTKTRKIIRTMPGALELLPTYDGAAAFTSGRRKVNFFNVKHWQHNVVNTQAARSHKRVLAKKFRKALELASKTALEGVSDLSTLPPSLRSRMLVIARDGYKTLQSVRVERNLAREPQNYVDLRNALRNQHGDGSVPHASSCCYWNDIQTLMVTSSWFASEHSHAFILKDERVQRLIGRFLLNRRFRQHSPGSSVKRVVGVVPINGDPKQAGAAQLD